MGRSNISLVGNTTTGQNLGGGAGVYIGKNNANNLQFKSFVATGGSIQLYQTANRIYIGGGGGTGGTAYIFIPSGGTIISQDGGFVTIYSPTGGTGGGTFNTVNNGLTAYGANITLGGALTGNTSINIGSNDICFHGTANESYICYNSTNIELALNSGSLGTYMNCANDSVEIYTLGNACMCVDGLNDIVTLSTIGGANVVLTGSTLEVGITGALKLHTTPIAGGTSKTALVWDSGTTQVKGVPVIDEWVGNASGLTYTGQKYSYPTHSIFQTDVSTCILIPNYILISNINLAVANCTCCSLFTIPTGKAALFNRAKFIFLCDAAPNSMKVSIGNKYCGVDQCCSYTNLVSKVQIDDATCNCTYDLTPLQQGVPASEGSTVYLNVISGSTSSLCAHLLLEGFLY